MKKAVFLDRDGTVNKEVGYLTDLQDLALIPGAGTAIRKLNQAGFLVVLVTNQSGVARGYFTEDFVQNTHERLVQMLREEGAWLDGIYYCPHHPSAGNAPYVTVCECRKPATGLIDCAVHDLNIDKTRSYMVGDKWIDVELGQRAGIRTVLVSTGFDPDDPANVKSPNLKDPDFRANDLFNAADWIIRHGAGNAK
ncbi:MAG: HAD family hydrolase [Nitrospirota bacterium]